MQTRDDSFDFLPSEPSKSSEPRSAHLDRMSVPATRTPASNGDYIGNHRSSDAATKYFSAAQHLSSYDSSKAASSKRSTSNTLSSAESENVAKPTPGNRASSSDMESRLAPTPAREEFPFLLAEHPFDARSLDESKAERDPTAVCLSFGARELAYVHYVHSSGWSDVTLVKSGERGWVPIDYFSGFSDPRAIPLLAAVAAFLANPRSQKLLHHAKPAAAISASQTNPQSSTAGDSRSKSSLRTFSEAAINEIISGTKLLLDKTQVLSRNAPLVTHFTEVAVARKTLLTELAHVVQVAKLNKHSVDVKVIDKLVRGSYRLLERAVVLLSTVDYPEVRQMAVTISRKQHRLSSSSHRSARSQRSNGSSSKSSGERSSPGKPGLFGLGLSTSQTSQDSTSAAAANSSSSPRFTRAIRSNGGEDDFSENSAEYGDVSDAGNSSSTYGNVSAATNESQSSSRIYRLRSFTEHSEVPHPIDRLQEVVNAFVYYLQGFLEPEDNILRDPENLNTSPTILELTRHSMLACRELLPVLDLGPPYQFDSTRDELLEEIRRLVTSARSVVASLPPSPPNLLSVASQSLVASASKCLNLCLLAARDSRAYLLTHPELSLSSSGTYPVFDVGEMVDLNLPLSRPGSPSDGSMDEDERNVTNSTTHSAIASQKGPVSTDPEDFDQSLKSARLRNALDPNVPHHMEQQSDPGVSKLPTVSETHATPFPPNTAPYTSVAATTSAGVPGVTSASNLTVPAVPKSDVAGRGPVVTADGIVIQNGKVRGGTLTALVTWLTGKEFGQLEMEIRVFLLTFRLFTTPRDLVIELGGHESSEGAAHMAELWVKSFWERDDDMLNSLEPLVNSPLIAARRKLLQDGHKVEQIIDLPLNPHPNSYAAESGRSFSSSSTSSFAPNNSSVSLLLRNNSFSTQFSTSSALNLAQTFRDFSLGARRGSRQASQDDVRLHNNFSGSNIFGAGRQVSTSSQVTIPDSGAGSSGKRNSSGMSLVYNHVTGSNHASLSMPGTNKSNSNVVPSSSNSEVIEYLLNRNSADVAQQLTLMWCDILKSMRPSELLDQRYSSSKRRLGLAPHVNQFILSSNHVSSLVGDTILASEISHKLRTRVLKQWIRIADDMYSLGNLNGLVTILLTLKSSRIMRLVKLWESLAAKYHAVIEKLDPLVTPARNFAEYRRELQHRYGQPCVPYIGVLLSDLTLIDEGNPKKLKDTDAINFDRYMRLGQAIAAFQPFQLSFYDVTPDTSLQSWLRNQSALSFSRENRDSDDQWRRSILIQPQD